MGPIKEINSTATTDDSAELSYFFEVIDTLIKKTKEYQRDGQSIPLTLVARSPESCISKALYQYKETLSANNIQLKAIFSQLSPSEDLNNWLCPQTSPVGHRPEELIRWAKHPNLADAHEQLTLDQSSSWSGESMRRDVSSRFGVYIFEEDDKKAADLAQKSFAALWNASKPIPQIYFKRANTESNSDFLIIETDTVSLSQKTDKLLSPEFTRH